MEKSKMKNETKNLYNNGSNVVLNAVASILAQHQADLKSTTSLTDNNPMLVLTNIPGKSSLKANVILGSPATGNMSTLETARNRESLVQSLEEQVHALATANLLASTQRDIAAQLAEAEADSPTAAELDKLTSASRRDKNSFTLGTNGSPNKKQEKKNTCKGKDSTKKILTKCKNIGEAELKALVCPYEGCSRKFAWLTHLKYHELTHTNNRQFKCPMENCGKTFFTNQRLTVHLRTHTGERPFKCSHGNCGKTFTTAGNLKNHQRIHTGEQPFVCDIGFCERRFTEFSSLKKHKLTHSGDKPYECKLCGKKFTQSGTRKQHLLRHHLEEEIRESLKEATSKQNLQKRLLSPSDEEIKPCLDNKLAASINAVSCMQKKMASSINAVSCMGEKVDASISAVASPQVLVIKNSYHDMPTSESLVFPHELENHIVVNSQSPEKQSLSLSQTLLGNDGLPNDSLDPRTDELVVLSEASMYQSEEHSGDIIYSTDILEHEEVAQADYVTTNVEYENNLGQAVTLPAQFDQKHSNESGLAITDYVRNTLNVTTDANSKLLSETCLTEITHVDFIGAEEVAVDQFSSLHDPHISQVDLQTSSQEPQENSNLSADEHIQMDPMMELDD